MISRISFKMITQTYVVSNIFFGMCLGILCTPDLHVYILNLTQPYKAVDLLLTAEPSCQGIVGVTAEGIGADAKPGHDRRKSVGGCGHG